MSEMREPTFAILTSLAAQPRHGYGVMSDVAETTGGALRLQPGTLYAALERLQAEGLVAVHGDEVLNGRLRRLYALTDSGTSVLRAEAERRRAGARRALDRLGVLGARPVAGA